MAYSNNAAYDVVRRALFKAVYRIDSTNESQIVQHHHYKHTMLVNHIPNITSLVT